MKKTAYLLILVMALTAVLFCSCKDGGNNTTDGGTNSVGGDYIFKPASEISIVVSKKLISEKLESEEGVMVDNPDYVAAYAETVSKLQAALEASGAELKVSFVRDDTSKKKHEIIFGECERELSRQAYRNLESISDKESQSRFSIYSNGSSVAIAFEPGDYEIGDIAMDYFIENYVTGKITLTFDRGYKYTENVDMIAYYEKKSEAKIATQWAELEKSILTTYKSHYGDDEEKAVKLANSTVKSLKQFYSSIDKDGIVRWLANLYEPNICVCDAVKGSDECDNTPYCGGAGFYFSNNGRDVIGFMPDIESTAQAFGFLVSSGMLDSVGGDVASAFPDGEVEKIVKWVKSMQDADDGYFYHPQWSKQETQANNARMGRDLGYAVSILSRFSEKPTYDTPSGVSGDVDILPTSSIKSSQNYLTGRLGKESTVIAVSRVVAVAETSVPSFLASEAAFRNYLKGLNIRTESYLVGNEIASVSEQIKARDKELANMNASYRLTDILMAWFEENQNSNGTWHWGSNEDPYYANNGVLKIIAAYNTLGREFPNPLPAINNAITALTCDTPINHVCDLYNTWFAIYYICDNIRAYGNKDVADAVMWNLREQAPAAIDATTVKMAACRCEDGSYSYHPGVTQTTSQGLPVAAPTAAGEDAKGDVNATVICTYGNITYMFGALGLYGAPDLCTEADRLKFKDIISELQPVIKNASVDPYDPNTFDTAMVDTTPEDYKFLIGDGDAVSYIIVEEDYREGVDGNIMRFHSDFSSWDRFDFGTKTGIGGDAFIFESDICIKDAFEIKTNADGEEYESRVTTGNLMEIHLGSGQNATSGFYKILIRVEDGKIQLRDYSSSKDGEASSQYTELYNGIDYGEWFHIKVEYFKINEKDARINVYIGSTRADMELVRVSDNFFDYYASKIDNPNAEAPAVGVYVSSMIAAATKYKEDILFDNFCAYRSRVNYQANEELPLNKNVDGLPQEEVIYDFGEITELPEEFLVQSGENTLTIGGGYLNLSGGKFQLPANFRESGANVASFSADLLWENGSGGQTLLSLLFTEGENKVYNVLGLDFTIKTIDETQYLVLTERQPGGGAGVMISTVKISKNQKTNIKIDFYHAENVALIYVGGVFVTSTNATYSNSDPRIIDKLTVESASGSIKINNLKFEKFKFDFATAVEPDTPSDVYEFDDLQTEQEKGVATGNVTASDGYALLSGKNSYVIAPLDERSPVVSAHLVKFIVVPDGISGDAVRLAILDENQNIIIAVDVTMEEGADGTLVKVYETGKGGRYGLVIASRVVAYGKDVLLSLVWHPDELTANIEIDGVAAGATSVCYDSGVQKNTPAYGTVYSLSEDVVKIDDLISESIYKYRAPVVLEGTNPENNSTKLTYDYSAATNLPKAFTMSLYAGGSAVRVEQALKKIGNAKADYSKALVIDSRTGANDEFIFQPSSETVGQNRVVFETEMMLSSESTDTTTLFQIMLTNSSWHVRYASYMLTIGRVGNKVVLSDTSSTGKTDTDKRYENNYIVLGEVDQWFKLRVEYYQGDSDTVRIVIKVNDGQEVDIVKKNGSSLETIDSVRTVVSDNFYGYRSESAADAQPRNDINRVFFYGQTASKAVVYMDNTSFFGDAASCVNNEVNFVKELK